MVDPIARFTPIDTSIPFDPLTAADQAAPVAGAGSSGAVFQSVLNAAVDSVEGAQQTAASAVQSVLEGKSGELHSAILATQRAELEFQLFLQYRNKVVSAYQEIMKVQL
jgi:flagellar hook-basal body complex protein FliE